MKLKVVVFLLMLIYTTGISGQETSISRVEPPFWWAGMKNARLQLLVYGKNISVTTPEIDYPGVKIEKVAVSDNPNYLFIDLVFNNKKVKPGTFNIRFMKDKTVLAEYPYEIKPRVANSAARKGFNQSDVIYLLMPDRFANGDLTNDSVDEMIEKGNRSNPSGRHGGDIKGIAEHIEYFKTMGFTAVWMNPLLENNQFSYTYHGYAITDFYRIDPRFGTNQDYQALVNQFHKNGIKVIMDFIFNHCGSNHWWMKDLPSQDWINRFPEFTRSNFRGGCVFDPYASEHDRMIFQNGWFDTLMPDLNQRNPFLANYLIQNSIWWIEYAGIDGIRMDTYPYPEQKTMTEWACRVKEEYPDFSMVGEVWLPEPSQVAAWQAGAKLGTGYESCLPYVFDFPMYDAFRHAFTEPNGWSSGIIRMYDVLTQDYLYSDPLNIVTFADNHDGDRIYTKLGQDFGAFRRAMAFLMTIRGVPQVYYGTEVLMTGYENRGHGDIRKDLPGGWPGDEKNAFTREGLTADELKASQFMERLLNWRKKKEVIHTGKLKHFIPVDGYYVYFRYNEKDTVMVVINQSKEDRIFNPAYYAEMVEDFRFGKNILTGKSVDLEKFQISAGDVMVLELSKPPAKLQKKK